MKTMIHKTGFDIGFNHTCKRGNQLKKHPLLGAQSYSNELFVFVHNFEFTWLFEGHVREIRWLTN
jgi:hypothetical protein